MIDRRQRELEVPDGRGGSLADRKRTQHLASESLSLAWTSVRREIGAEQRATVRRLFDAAAALVSDNVPLAVATMVETAGLVVDTENGWATLVGCDEQRPTGGGFFIGHTG